MILIIVSFEFDASTSKTSAGNGYHSMDDYLHQFDKKIQEIYSGRPFTASHKTANSPWPHYYAHR